MIFNNVIIFLNRRCNVGCQTCNVNSSPSDSQSLSKKDLLSIFRLHHKYHLPNFFIWTGGEPFLTFDELLYGIGESTRRQINSEILTSGGWFNKNPDYLLGLKKAGRFSLRISIDGEHQKKVPFHLILDLVREALALKIRINFTLREIPNQNFDINDHKKIILRKFPELNQDSRSFHHIPHFYTCPDGNNRPIILQKNWQKPCEMILKDLVIGNDKNIYPCCGIFKKKDFPQWALADLGDFTPEGLVRAINSIPDIKLLREKGPFGILNRENLDLKKIRWTALKNPCDLCFALWDN